jgi:hypothetical protein
MYHVMLDSVSQSHTQMPVSQTVIFSVPYVHISVINPDSQYQEPLVVNALIRFQYFKH